MVTAIGEYPAIEIRGTMVEARYEPWTVWPVHWTGIWIGALAAIAAVVIFSLIGVAVGAHLLGSDPRVADIRHAGWATLIFSVCGAFFSFVIGGWTAAKIAGILRSEPAMLHGAIAWLVAIPLLIVLVGAGGGALMGGWFGGLSGRAYMPMPGPVQMEMPPAPGAQLPAAEDPARLARNAALGAASALLLGLVGSAIGGWMASGEPMTLTHYRNRTTNGAMRAPRGEP